jgi:Protein phosphatase 2C
VSFPPDEPPLVGGRGVPGIGDPGRAARELPAGFPPAAPAVPDHVLAEYATDDLEIRAASVRGLLHRYREQPRQDAFSVVHDPASDTTVVVVCDGVGSLPRSHEAAAFVVDRLPMHYWAHRDWDTAVKAVNAELHDLATRAVAAVDPADRDAHRMATTLVAVAIDRTPDGRRARIVRSDDSTVWRLTPDGTWMPAAADGPEAAGVHTGSVRALPAPSPRLHHTEVPFADGALFVMTDGVGTPLENAAEVRATLAGWWSSPPPIFRFGSQVGFARKTHMDDRTVVGVWPILPKGSG